MKAVYFNSTSYKNELELITKVIRIYSITRLQSSLAKREESILVFYIKFGYSKKTKDMIIKELDIRKTHLNQINYSLQNKGYLIKDNYNRQKKHLSPNLDNLRKSFLEDKLDTYVIRFVNER